MRIKGFVIAISVVLAPSVYAESFTTNIIDGIETNAGPQLTVGATGSYNFLLVTNSGKLTNGISILGDAAGAENNSAVVTGSNTVWHSTNSFILGNTGALNRVSVLDGAQFISGVITVGVASASNHLHVRNAVVASLSRSEDLVIGARNNANFNTVTFDGPGALGTNRITMVGHQGTSNSLVIRNGAQFIPNWLVVSSDGNSVEVSGAGSKLSMSHQLELGVRGSGNRLLVDGAELNTFGAYMSESHGANNNSALIQGAGAIWTNETSIGVGFGSTSNSLTILQGAQVVSAVVETSLRGGRENTITVSGEGSLLRAVRFLTLGWGGTGDVLRVTGGGYVNGGGHTVGLYGFDNFALVSGAGSGWSNIALDVGYSGGRNALRVEDGASLQTGELTIGRVARTWPILGNASHNTVELIGDGTRLSVVTNLNIGGFGHSNRFLVFGGARAEARNVHLGASSLASPGAAGPSDFNLLSVIGSNSFVMVESNVVVGFEGSSNRLEVFHGGQLHSMGAGVIGENSGANNSAFVSGPGSVWLMTNELVIGQQASGSSLVVSNGGFVRSQSGCIGAQGELELVGEGSTCVYRASGSSARVTGANSVWAIADSLVVGSNAIMNSLLITNGGRVFARDVTIGVTDGGRTCGGAGGNTVQFLNEIEIAGGNLDLDMNALNTLEVRYGTLRLRSGGVGALRLLMTNQSSRLELLGGSLVCSEAVIDNRFPLNIGDGLYNASFHGRYITAPRGIVVREHAMLASRGPITASITNFGTVSPYIFGTTVTGNFVQQPAGTLAIDIGFERAGTLIVSNVAVLSGKLLLRQNGEPPSNKVAIVTAAAVTGTFSNATNGTRLKTTDNRGSFVVEYTATRVTLRDYQSTDLNFDGIEDEWALRHFDSSRLTPAEKSADKDGDGASNYDEFVAGTDPENSTSVLRASISYANGAASVTFPSQEGKRYRIVWSPVLSSNPADWGTHVINPTFSFPAPGLCRWTEDGRGTGGLGSLARFFRVMLEFE